MSDLAVQVTGLNETIDRIVRTSRVMPSEIKRAIRTSGLLVERRMKLNLSGPAHMKYTYRDAGTAKQRMQAMITGEEVTRLKASNKRLRGSRYSLSGNNNQYPGVRTGKLRASVQNQVQDSGFAVVVGPTAAYAPYLELGTPKMQPYPFVGPTLMQTTPAILNEFEEAVRRSVQ